MSKLLATIVCDIGDTGESCSGVGMADLAVNDIDAAGLEQLLADYRFNAVSAARIRELAEGLG